MGKSSGRPAPPLSEAAISQIASAYGLDSPSPAGSPLTGRSWTTFRLTTGNRDIAVQRKKGSPERLGAKADYIARRLEGQHELMIYLRSHGFPVVGPLSTKDGKSWVNISNVPYALYPFVDGREMELNNSSDLTAAAMALAKYHQLTARYTGSTPISRDPFPVLLRERLDEFYKNAEALKESFPEMGVAQSVEYFENWVSDVEKHARSLPYDELPKAVIHGDYKPGNILFQDDRVTALIDFARSRKEARILDLSPIIYRLTKDRDETAFPSIQKFTDVYSKSLPMEKTELEALPVLIQARIAFKVAGKVHSMVKKGTMDERLSKARKFGKSVEHVQWMEKNLDLFHAAISTS